MSLQRQHFLLIYLKTLSVGPVEVWTCEPPAQQSGALPPELTGRRKQKYKQTFLIACSITVGKLRMTDLSISPR